MGDVLLTSAPHPFRVERSVASVPEGATLQKMLEETQPDPVLRAHSVVFIRGVRVDPEWWPRVRPKAGTHVEIRVVPKGGGGGKNPLRTLLTIAVIAAAAYFAGPGLNSLAAGLGNTLGLSTTAAALSAAKIAIAVGTFGALLLVNAIAPVRPPKLPSLSGSDGRDSPTLFIEGARNQARPFQPVPMLLGRHRVVPPYGALPFTEVVGDKQFVRMLFVWGIGPITLEEDQLRIGETLLTEFDSVKIEHRFGYPTDTALTLYPGQVVQDDFSVLLSQAADWVSRTASPDGDELSVDITFSQGLVEFNEQGRRQQRTVTFELQYREVGGPAWLYVNERDGAVTSSVTATFGDESLRKAIASATFRGGDGEALSYTATDTGFDGSSQNVHTASGMSIGAAAPDRYVVAVISHIGNDAGVLTEVTIGGIGATRAAIAGTGTDNESVEIYFAKVPTGTTADVVATFDTGSSARALLHVGTVLGSESVSVSDDSNVGAATGATLTVTPVVGADEVAVLGAVLSDPTTIDWSKATEEAETSAGELACGSASLLPDSIESNGPEITFPAEALEVDTNGDILSYTLTHSRTSAIRHGIRWEVSERAQYEVRMRRTSADTNDDSIFDTFNWSALRTFTDEDPINSPVPVAKTALVIRATDQLNRIIDEFNGIATSVGKDWDPTSPAQWLDDRPITNPASLFRHVLQGNGMAEPLTDARLDLTTLQDWHEFCDSRGFEFNMVRDFGSTVWETLADVTSAGRAAPTQVDGKWSVVVEQEQAVPVSHITPRNSYGFQSEKLFPDQPHGWRIRFPNEDEGWRQDERRVHRDGFDDTNATKFETLEFPGVTSSDQVFRLGRFRIAQGLLQPERFSFGQDMEFLTYQRGDRVALTHDVLLVGLASGRVKSVVVDTNNDVTSITVDEGLTMEASKQYGLAIRTVGNANVTAEVVTSSGTTKTVGMVSPIPNSGGQPAVAAGDLFGFGLLGSETDDASVVSIVPDSEFQARVTCVPYRAAVFDADTEAVPAFETNLTPLPVIPTPQVRNVVSDESVLAFGPGESLRTRIVVEFDPLDDPRLNGPRVEVQVRPTETKEPYFDARLDAATSGHVEIAGVHDGETWDIRLRFVVDSRLPGPWAEVLGHTVVGKSTPPDGLTGLTISVFGGQAFMRWDRPTALDVVFGGEVRFRHSQLLSGATWAGSVSIGETARARALLATLPLKPGTYLARVFDVSGNPSTDIVSVTTKQASVLEFADADTLDEAPGFDGGHSGTIATSGTLKLDGVGEFDAIPDVDASADIDAFGGIITTGTYDFAFGFDLTTVSRVRLTTRVTAVSTFPLDLVDDRTDLMDDWEDFDGTTQGAGDVQIFVRHTDGDPAASGAVFTEWERLDSAEFEARGFEFQARLTSEDPAFNIEITELGVDAEDIV